MENQMEPNLKSITEMIQEMAEVAEKRQKETVKSAKPAEEQQTRIVLCGGTDFSHAMHDVTICLVPNRIQLFFDEKKLAKDEQTLTKVKVHSSRLSECSKYFEACLAERWKKSVSSRDSSLDFVLEIHGDVRYYIDCFQRMYWPPFSKDFKDVNYSLALLKAASHIQFHELMDSVALYLSSKLWSDADEMVIRMYACGDDFPRSHAQDLVVRLGMDESKEECHKQLCNVMEQCIRSALACDGNFRSNRAFFKEMLPGSLPGSETHQARPCNAASYNQGNGLSNGPPVSGLSVQYSNCMRDVVTIVSREAKNMVVRVAKECEGKTYFSDPRFAEKTLAICWILETLLAARVAEEFVQCFVHLDALAKILASIDGPFDGHSSSTYYGANFGIAVKPGETRNAAVELAKLVLVIYQEVAAGNLLLKTPERVALLENWHVLLKKLLVGAKCSYDQPTKDLFMTLPLKQQMLLIQSRKDSGYENYISTSSLAKFVKKQWPAVEVKPVASSTKKMHS